MGREREREREKKKKKKKKKKSVAFAVCRPVKEILYEERQFGGKKIMPVRMIGTHFFF